jgi:membrane protease YdiL (CAAX protease family)
MVVLLVTYFLGYLLLFPGVLLLIDALIPGFYAWPYTDVIFHTIMTLVFLFLGSKLLQESNKHWSLNSIYIPIIASMVMLWGSVFLGAIIQTLSGQTDSVNQSLLYDMFKENRLSIIIQAVIFAPIAEEIIFRGVIYRHFKKAGRYLIPLIVSTLLFASMHSLNAILTAQWSDLWYIPLYAFMALVLSYTYEKTQNLYSSIMLHCINNSISILAMMYAVSNSLK